MSRDPASGAVMAGPPVQASVYRWAGAWGPFQIRVRCGECFLTEKVIEDVLANELDGVPVALAVHDWLSAWWKPLLRGGWHAPIVVVGGRIISQGQALNRGVFVEAVITAHARATPLQGSHVFGRDGCRHCAKARSLLSAAAAEYRYHDVVRAPRDLYEMLARVKPLIGASTPVTLPQVFLNGAYVGGAEELGEALNPAREML